MPLVKPHYFRIHILFSRIVVLHFAVLFLNLLQLGLHLLELLLGAKTLLHERNKNDFD